ncbi:hypothetical protein [Lactobacillus gasseri]|nr:hypothetical protein [Lactobacillus gasseri]
MLGGRYELLKLLEKLEYNRIIRQLSDLAITAPDKSSGSEINAK